MTWQTLGLIFDPTQMSSMGLSAALMPIAEVLDSERDLFRIYFAPRNERQQSQMRFFDIDLKSPQKILNISGQALLLPGKIGAFDDSGITPGNILSHGGRKVLYYTGWNLTVSVPFNNSIGAAVLGAQGNFERFGDGPVMTRALREPYSCASPFVMFDNGMYRMWYASMDRWETQSDGSAKHFYNLKYAESADGLEWRREGRVVVDYASSEEYAFGRPWILKERGTYKMWYSVRGARYVIGYAESSDGLAWVRKDSEAGTPQPQGWDSDMQTYPCVFDHRGVRYMLYNGNGYGKSGIGLARWV